MQEWHLLRRNQDHLSNDSNSLIKQDLKQVQVVQVSCHLHPPLWLWDMDPDCRLWEKDPSLQNQVHEETSRCRAKSDSLWPHWSHFWKLLGDRNLHGSGMTCTTILSKTSFRASKKRVGDAAVRRENAGWTSKNGHPCQCQNWSRRPPTEKAGRGYLLNNPSYFAVNTYGSRDWTELTFQINK